MRCSWHHGFLVLAIAITGCNKHPERTPEGTLSLLRGALASNQPPMASVADTRLVAQALAVQRSKQIEDRMGMPMTDRGLDQALRDAHVDTPPAEFFAGVLPMLRQGHCERIGDEVLPDVIEHVPAPGDHWPPRMRQVQSDIARRATGAMAADYRCDGGPSFGAVFVHPYPNDGTWRVAQIGPSRHR